MGTLWHEGIRRATHRVLLFCSQGHPSRCHLIRAVLLATWVPLVFLLSFQSCCLARHVSLSLSVVATSVSLRLCGPSFLSSSKSRLSSSLPSSPIISIFTVPPSLELPRSLTPADLIGCAHLSVSVVPVLSPHLWSSFSARLYDDSPV